MENSLVLQWLGLCAFTAKDPGSIPSWETKISQPAQCGQKKIFFFFITQIERAKEKSVLKKKKKIQGELPVCTRWHRPNSPCFSPPSVIINPGNNTKSSKADFWNVVRRRKASLGPQLGLEKHTYILHPSTQEKVPQTWCFPIETEQVAQESSGLFWM